MKNESIFRHIFVRNSALVHLDPPILRIMSEVRKRNAWTEYSFFRIYKEEQHRDIQLCHDRVRENREQQPQTRATFGGEERQEVKSAES
jgi:hypothetical protein